MWCGWLVRLPSPNPLGVVNVPGLGGLGGLGGHCISKGVRAVGASPPLRRFMGTNEQVDGGVWLAYVSKDGHHKSLFYSTDK